MKRIMDVLKQWLQKRKMNVVLFVNEFKSRSNVFEAYLCPAVIHLPNDTTLYQAVSNKPKPFGNSLASKRIVDLL